MPYQKEIIWITAFTATLLVVWVHAWIPAKLSADAGDKHMDRVTNPTSFALGLIASFSFQIAIIYFWLIGNLHQSTLREILGFSLCVLGAVLRYWSIKTLGNLFTLEIGIRSMHKLIENGPYKYLLHPSYTGALLAILGFCIYFGVWKLSMPYIILVLIVYFQRIRSEEKMLLMHFGNAYTIRIQKCWRLFPFIY